ncbi:MAG: hypothetical protein QOC66_3859, partial [Pseudonocardiales bacterium]|nr:hypothetical protein [Pseudonocardiales bacterium]
MLLRWVDSSYPNVAIVLDHPVTT